MDLDRSEVRGPTETWPLTQNEVGLLVVLSARPGQIVEREQLLVDGLGYRRAVATRAIDQAIWRLRRKLEEEPSRPVHLRSTPSAGYFLVLEAPVKAQLIGRADELARIDAWLAEGATEVWLVGPPGIGRRALAEQRFPSQAVIEESSVVPPDTAPIARIATRMPPDPKTRAIRLGPLAHDPAVALLVDRVLAVRGTARLADAERSHVDALVRLTDGHPGTLVQLAGHAVLRGLDAIDPGVVRAGIGGLVELARGLPPALGRALAVLAQLPDAFDADEGIALVGEAALAELWRVSAIEREPEGPGFRVLAPMREALASTEWTPDDPDRWVRVMQERLWPLVSAAAGGLREANDALVARTERIVRLVVHTADPRWLPALHVVAHKRSIAVPELPEPLDDDQRAAHALVRASAAEEADRDACRRISEPLMSLHPADPGIEGWLVRWVMRRRLYDERPVAELEEVVDRAARAAERHGSPVSRATHLQLRALVASRRGEVDPATADLVAALRLLEGAGAGRLAGVVRSNLATITARDGRPSEALVWAEAALAEVESPEQEVAERLRFTELLLAAGETAEVEHQLVLLDALGRRPQMIAVVRGWLDLVRGDHERAAVRLLPYHGAPHEPGMHADSVLTLLAWARLLQGDGAGALAALSPVPERAWPSSRRVRGYSVAVARRAAGDAAGAREVLDAFAPPEPRWWSLGRQVFDAYDAAVDGRPFTREAVDRATRGPVRNLMITLLAGKL
ncbi:MAG: helix-turn-helix domain-containing protein [Myxococcota bacterium]